MDLKQSWLYDKQMSCIIVFFWWVCISTGLDVHCETTKLKFIPSVCDDDDEDYNNNNNYTLVSAAWNVHSR